MRGSESEKITNKQTDKQKRGKECHRQREQSGLSGHSGQRGNALSLSIPNREEKANFSPPPPASPTTPRLPEGDVASV